MALAQPGNPIPARGTAPAPLRLGVGSWRPSLATSGCQSGGGCSRLWRQGADSSLSKGPTKDELNDNRNLMARWLTPKKNPHSDPDAINPPSPWSSAPTAGSRCEPPKNPEADAEFEAAERLFQQGKLAEAETRLRQARQEAQGDPLGREGPVLPGRDASTSAASTSTPTTASRSSSPTTPAPSSSTSSSAASTPSPRSGSPRATPRPSPSRSSPGTPGSPASSP